MIDNTVFAVLLKLLALFLLAAFIGALVGSLALGMLA
jgi:hypothetical protein